MRSSESSGLAVGILLVVQLAGFIVPFALLHPLSGAGFLQDAAPAARSQYIALALLYLNCALTILISLIIFPVLARYNQSLAVGLVAAAIVMFVLQALDNMQLVSMLSLSQQFAQAGSDHSNLELLGTFARSARKWAHYPELVAIDTWIFLLSAALYRFRMVPRALAAAAMVTVLLHLVAIPLPLIFGFTPVTPLGAVMGLGEIGLAVWLIFKGFGSRPITAEYS